MNLIENTFKHKGVNFEVIKRGDKAILLKAEAPFYDSDSLEVWEIKTRPERMIKDRVVEAQERKPSNEDYPEWASQYFRKRFDSDESFMEAAENKFNQINKKKDNN